MTLSQHTDSPHKLGDEILKYSILGLQTWEEELVSIDDYLDRLTADGRVRKSVTHILFSYFRNKAVIDMMVDESADFMKPETRLLLQVVVTQMNFQSSIAKESAINIAVDYTKKDRNPQTRFVNAILRKLNQTTCDEFLDSLSNRTKKRIFPALYRRWKHHYGADVSADIIDVIGTEAGFTFRNTTPLSKEQCYELEASPLDLGDWSGSLSFYSTSDPYHIFAGGHLQRPGIYIQDPATALAPNLFEDFTDNDVILDMCSAPGGKALILSDMMSENALLISSDYSARRQERTLQNIRRFEKNIPVIAASADNPPLAPASATKILLDVPCSNTGVIRKRPDAQWRFSDEHLKEINNIQYSLLEKSSELLKPGGQLVYSTCSIEPEENNIMIEDFLRHHTDFELICDHQLLPSYDHDGAYAALLKKRDN